MILSLTGKRKWILPALCAVAVLAVILPLAIRLMGGAPKGEGEPFPTEAATEEDRREFLARFGWEVSSEPALEDEVTIPGRFDDVYTAYNDLQKQQGLDLTPYRGKTCRRYVYTIENYSGDEERVLATLLVYDGRVVGGDLSSARLDGFMTTFFGEGGTPQTEEGAASSPEKALDADAYPVD